MSRRVKHAAKDTASVVAKGLVSAVVAAGGTYLFDGDSRFPTDLYGLVELPGYQAFGIISGVSSVAGELLGNYAIPMLEQKAIGNDMLEKLLKHGLPPTISGGTYVLLKKYGTDAPSNMGKDFLIGGGSDLVAQQLVSALF